MKRTLKVTNLKRKRTHGFKLRMSTKAGRAILSNRRSKKRKSLFIQIILPLILEENNLILLDRKKLFSILNKNKNSKK